MKEEIMTLAKTAAKSSAKVLVFALLALFLGFVVNIIFLVSCAPEMKAILSQLGGIPAARAGGIGAILALVFILIAIWPIILLIFAFGLGFPISYLFAAKGHFMKKEIASLVSQNKGWFVDNISRFLAEKIWKKADSDHPGAVRKVLLEKMKDIPAFLNEEDNWPVIVRVIVRKILRSLHLENLAKEIAGQYSESETFTRETLETALQKNLHRAIDERLEPSPPLFLYLLIALNLGIFLYVKISY